MFLQLMKKNPQQPVRIKGRIQRPPQGVKKAFSLLELSIVVLIISIMVIGSMTSSITALNNAKYKATRDRMAEIYKALGVYLLVNKALPCPASLEDLKSSSSNYGVAGTTVGTCNSGDGVYVGNSSPSSGFAYGMIPVQTLGLNADMAEDGFGNRFTYIVATAFTQPDVEISDSTGFGRATATSIMTVKESLDTSGSTYQTNTSDAIFVIISHGANGYGAFGTDSAAQNSASSDSQELKNHATYGSFSSGSSSGTATFYSGSAFIASASNSGTFDDVVFYRSRNMMVLDYDAMNLIVCRADGTNSGDYTLSSTTFAWPQTDYGEIVSATTTCAAADSAYTTTVTYPTKRCGPFGVWQVGTISPCTN